MAVVNRLEEAMLNACGIVVCVPVTTPEDVGSATKCKMGSTNSNVVFTSRLSGSSKLGSNGF